jgi:hypothetical protein
MNNELADKIFVNLSPRVFIIDDFNSMVSENIRATGTKNAYVSRMTLLAPHTFMVDFSQIRSAARLNKIYTERNFSGYVGAYRCWDGNHEDLGKVILMFSDVGEMMMARLCS